MLFVFLRPCAGLRGDGAPLGYKSARARVCGVDLTSIRVHYRYSFDALNCGGLRLSTSISAPYSVNEVKRLAFDVSAGH